MLAAMRSGLPGGSFSECPGCPRGVGRLGGPSVGTAASAADDYNLVRQREALAKLRREVAELDAVAASEDDESFLLTAAGDFGISTLSGGAGTFAAAAAALGGATAGVGQAQYAWPAAVASVISTEQADLEGQSRRLVSKLGEAEAALAQAGLERGIVRTEWASAMSRCAASESKEEKQLQAMQRELEELQVRASKEEATFKAERERLRQRLHALRLRSRQTERKDAMAAKEEAFLSQFQEPARATTPGRPRSAGAPAGPPAASRRSASGGKSAAGSAARPPSSGASLARLSRSHLLSLELQQAKSSLHSSQEDVAELQGQRQVLLHQQLELQERERGLRRAARLSEREVGHLRRLSELHAQAAAAEQDAEGARLEVETWRAALDEEQRCAEQFRGTEDRAASELHACDRQFQQRRSESTQALTTIDRYMASAASSSAASPGRDRRAALAEWIEADVVSRQVEHMKRRLAEIVESAGATARALEQAITELHADLDRRAAIILELVERQRDVGSSGATPPPGSCTSPLDSSGASHTTLDPHITGDREALGAELQDQRVLFDLRSEQVQGLEQRLSALLAREAPRVHALRSWIAVQDPISQERLRRCEAAAAREKSLQHDVAAMREDKSRQLEELEDEWRQRRQQILAAGGRAKRAAELAFAQVATLEGRRDELLKVLDRLSRVEKSVVTRAAAARDLVGRDQQALVDAELRRLRASASVLPWPELSGHAKESVEMARAEQLKALGELQEQAGTVAGQLLRVGEALRRAQAREEQAESQVAEVEQHRDHDRAEPAAAAPAPAGPAAGSGAVGSVGEGRPRPGGAAGSAPTTPRKPRPGGQAPDSELERLAAQLSTLEERHEHSEVQHRAARLQIEENCEEYQKGVSLQREQQRSSSSGVLRRYRHAEATAARAEQQLSELLAQRAEVDQELLVLRQPATTPRAGRAPAPLTVRPGGCGAGHRGAGGGAPDVALPGACGDPRSSRGQCRGVLLLLAGLSSAEGRCS